jgi:hypothetical protein
MWEFCPSRVRLLGTPRPGEEEARRIAEDFERFRDGLPRPLEPYIRATYGIDLASEYAGLHVKNPFGKASGQLSLARHQVQQDADGGLGFVVLKTVIAQDASGEQSMREWAIPETRMTVEPIRGRRGEEGWTVTWKGRGWFDTFEAYGEFFGQALSVGQASDMLVVPSVKYHLPGIQETSWKQEEYSFTTCRLLKTWSERYGDLPMPLEKDFSPTLAGSERATQQAKIVEWLEGVPGLIHGAAPGRVRVGLKMFNALFEDDFQLQMLDTVHSARPGEDRADFLVYANRLFDPAKEFEGKLGVAYGGPDLSGRNLAVLEQFLFTRSESAGVPAREPKWLDLLPLSATGNIHSGRIAVEYLLRGASSFQMHTIFQLQNSAFAMKTGSKTEMSLHHLLFHPQEGFVAWLLDLRRRFGWGKEMNVQQMARWCRGNWKSVTRELSPSAAVSDWRTQGTR